MVTYYSRNLFIKHFLFLQIRTGKKRVKLSDFRNECNKLFPLSVLRGWKVIPSKCQRAERGSPQRPLSPKGQSSHPEATINFKIRPQDPSSLRKKTVVFGMTINRNFSPYANFRMVYKTPKSIWKDEVTSFWVVPLLRFGTAAHEGTIKSKTLGTLDIDCKIIKLNWILVMSINNAGK